jgi:hypothetical protein
MTLRELSERVRDHLTQQRAQSTKVDSCAYRGENDTMCAVGCLIDDDHYDDRIEGTRVGGRLIRYALKSSLGFELNHYAIRMLSHWQFYHDDDCGRYVAWLYDSGNHSPAIQHDARMQGLIDDGIDPDSSAARSKDHGQS